MTKKVKAIRNLITIVLLVLFTNFSYAQKIELESLNIINSDLRVEGGNLIIKENATISLNSKINITGGDKDEFKVRIVFSGVDANMKDVRASAEYTYSKKSNTNGNNLSLKLPPHTQLRISSVAHFVDDWQGETAYISLNKPTKKTNLVLMLNGIAKPLNKGVCQFGRCFCIEGSQGNDCDKGRKIEFDSMVISQTIKKNKENDYTWSMTTGFTQNANNSDIPSLDQLVAWGELEAFISAELVDAKGNKETIKVPCDLSADKGICLFNGQKNIVSPSGVTLTTTICHFRTAPGAIFGISSTSIYLRNKTAYQKPSSDNFTWTETWVSKKEDYHLCHKNELSAGYMDYKENEKTISVLIGVNKSKSGKTNDLEKRLTDRSVISYGVVTWQAGNEKPLTHIIKAFETQEGNWQYSDEIAKTTGGVPQFAMIAFDLFYVTICQDTFKYTSVFKQELKDKKDWDYTVTMKNTIAYDNPVFQPINGGLTNILALTAPSSGINISGGSIALNDNAKFDFTISNGSVGNGGLDFKKINAGSVTIQFAAKGDGRVFWHWSFPVTTTNPKITINTDSLKLKDYTIKNIEIRLINERNDTIIYEYNKDYAYSIDGKETLLFLEKSDKIRYYEACKTNYRLKTVSYDEVTVSGIYVLKFSFSMENNSDIPHSTAMVAEIKDCNGKSQYIGITLTYNATTEIYTGGVNISVVDKCNYEFHYGEIGAYNVCKDKTVWSVSAADSKSNGKGTRVVATTTNGTPGLL